MTDRPWERGQDPARRLLGRVAIVTGAGSAEGLIGIGAATAVLFAAQGARIGIVDVSAERAAATRKLIEEIGGDCIEAIGDLTVAEENQACVSRVAEHFGGVDVLVNSAAVTAGGGSPVDVDMEQWRRAMAVNLDAIVLTAKHTIPHMRSRGGGAVVNISSIAAMRGMGSGAYAASKAAMIGLTKDWAYLHGRDGIRVNCVVPGHVYTPMGNQGGEDLRQRRRRAGLLGTEGVAWDVAWAVVFFASEESRWITGTVLPVDAGTTSSTALGLEMLNQRHPEG